MLIVSTRYKELILGPNSFESIFNNGRILVYSGPQPESADFPVHGTLLAEISNDGTPWNPYGAGGGGLLFLRDGQYVLHDDSQSWRMRVIAGGTAGWFRLCGPAPDDGSLSYSLPRVDGAIGMTGTSSELLLETTVLTTGQNIAVQQFIYTIPPILGV